MAYKLFFIFIAFLSLEACTSDDDSGFSVSEQSQIADAPQITKTDVVTGLENPWDMAFTSSQNMFYTEKCKGLSVRMADGTVHHLFGTLGSGLVAPDFFCAGQSGMHGVALDPNFETNRRIYVYMPSNLSIPPLNRVVRLEVSTDFTTVAGRTDIITDIPFKNDANEWGERGSHSGGRIRFSPEGFLFVTTGDNHNGPLPQDLSKLGGKVLRVNTDGEAVAGNNPPAGADPRIYVYGIRNVQGLAFKPGSGRVFIAEHGPNHTDEVTALSAGGNGGWDPVPDAGVTCGSNYCGYISNKLDGTLTPMTDLVKYPAALQPLWVLPDSQGMGAAEFLTGTQWKGWNNALLVSTMASQLLHVVGITQNDRLDDVRLVPVPQDRIRSLVQGPDGNLYIATDSGQIWKVSPVQEE